MTVRLTPLGNTYISDPKRTDQRTEKTQVYKFLRSNPWKIVPDEKSPKEPKIVIYVKKPSRSKSVVFQRPRVVII